MSTLLTSFGTGVSGLHVAQTGLNTAAHNIANTDTVGYVRQQVIVTDHVYDTRFDRNNGFAQTGLGTHVSLILQRRSEFLDKQYREEAGRLSFYDVRSETVLEMSDLFGELNNESFSQDISSIWSAFQELSKTPDDITSRELLISEADSFLNKCQTLYKQIGEYQTNLNSRIKNLVKEVNDKAEQIYKLNCDIVWYKATGQQPNDLYDARNQILDDLSKIVPIRKDEYKDGSITISIEGTPLVTGDSFYHMTTEKINDGCNLLKPVWEDNGGGDVFRESLDFSTEAGTDIGTLKGIIVTRGSFVGKYTDMPVKPNVDDYKDATGKLDDTAYRIAMNNFDEKVRYYNEMVKPSVITTLQTQLDTLVHGMVTMINDVLCPNKEVEVINAKGEKELIKVLDEDNAPMGCNGTVGNELFKRANYDRYADTEVTLSNGTKVTVKKYNEEDPSNLYSLYTMSQVSINSDIVVDSANLPLLENTGSGFAGGYSSAKLADLLDKWDDAVLVLDPNSNTSYNFNDFYTGMIGELGTSGRIANNFISSETTLVNSIDNQRQSLTGVSTDEELTDIIRFQHMYNACSRYITVIDEMLESLIMNL